MTDLVLRRSRMIPDSRAPSGRPVLGPERAAMTGNSDDTVAQVGGY